MVDKVSRGEIYYVYSAAVTGNEQNGGRPAVIVSNDIGNVHSPIVEVVYLTTKEKKPLPTHVWIASSPKPSIVLCEQIETVHKGRIGNYIGQLFDAEIKALDKALAVSLGIGLTIKSNKLVMQWGEAYAEEPDRTVANAMAKIDKSEFPEEEAKATVDEPEHVEHVDIAEMLVKYKTERDVFKELYSDLLKSIQGRIA